MLDGRETTSKTNIFLTLLELLWACCSKGEIAWQFQYSVTSEQKARGAIVPGAGVSYPARWVKEHFPEEVTSKLRSTGTIRVL